MSKLLARYFYAPNCPESYATQERLEYFFQTIPEIYFDSFNIIEDKLKSEFTWFPEEEEIINSLYGPGNKALLYGKLFIGGTVINGFPPFARSIEEVLVNYNIEYDIKQYKFYYSNVNRGRWDCRTEGFSFKRYDEGVLMDVCKVCTKYHPFLSESDYIKEKWIKHEKEKAQFLRQKLKEGKVIGIIAYYQERPIAIIEGYSLETAKKLGFPVLETSDKGLMITCLSVRKETKGHGIASRLVTELEKEAKLMDYKKIEVLAFPDHHNYQPVSLYKKLAYLDKSNVDDLIILNKDLTSV